MTATNEEQDPIAAPTADTALDPQSQSPADIPDGNGDCLSCDAKMDDADIDADPQPEPQPQQTPQQTPEEEESTTTTTTKKKKAEFGYYYDIELKPGYTLQERHSSLPPLPQTNHNNNDNDTNDPSNSKGSKVPINRHKKNVKNSFKRGREETLSDLQVCKSLMSNQPCSFGSACKYSHDVKLLLSIREPDIVEVDGGCPRFVQYGSCPFGLSCRVGGMHLNLATGENLTKIVTEGESNNDGGGHGDGNGKGGGKGAMTFEESVKNVISYNVMTKLRKHQYDFVCKKFQKKAKKKNHKNREKDEQRAKETKETDSNGGTGKDHHGDADMSPGDAKAIDTETQPKVDEAQQSESATSTIATTPTTPTPTTTTTPPDLSPLPKTKKLIDFRNKVYIAPLTTVGNLPFRRIMKKYGADITCGEMAVAHTLLQGKAGEWALLKRHVDEDVFGVQIAAGHADLFERVSEVIAREELEVDFVDMNLGCPLDILCRNGAGAKLMQRERALQGAIEGMGKNLHCPITVKIRTGWDEKKPFAHKLVPKIQQWGMGNVAAVMVHGRSRLQRYSKLADWDYVDAVAKAQSEEWDTLPVIGNGDIFSYVDYEEKVLKHDGLSPTAMLGRGALIKPWLPIEIKERRHWDISASERLDILKDYVKFGLEHWGSDTRGVNNTRRFLLEWLSFLYRYVPFGLIEASNVPQQMNHRPPRYMCGRSDLETLMMSDNCADWVKISEMLLGKVRDGFDFQPKHKARSYN